MANEKENQQTQGNDRISKIEDRISKLEERFSVVTKAVKQALKTLYISSNRGEVRRDQEVPVKEALDSIDLL